MIFFFDENMSYRIANMLSALCEDTHQIIHIRYHDDFKQNNIISDNSKIISNTTPDEEWIPGLARSGKDWKIISHDSNILDKPHIRPIVDEAGLTFFACDHRWGKLGGEQAWRMVKLWDDIVKHAKEPSGSLFRLCFPQKSYIETIRPGMRARGGRLRN